MRETKSKARWFGRFLVWGYAVFLAGLLQLNVKKEVWIINYGAAIEGHPNYALRWIYPFLVSLIPLPPVYGLWLVSSLFWFLSAFLFYAYLKHLQFSDNTATLGAVIPILNFATIITGFYTPDGLNFCLVLGVFLIMHKCRNRPLRRRKDTARLFLCLAPLGAVWIFTSYPIPISHTQPLLFLGRVILAFGVWVPFLLAGLVSKENKGGRLNLVLALVFPLVCWLATDWDRWIVLAAPLWVPLALRGIEKVFTREKCNTLAGSATLVSSSGGGEN